MVYRIRDYIDLDDTHTSVLSEDAQDSHDIQSLVELCVNLQEKVKFLENTVSDQSKGLCVLEARSTEVQLKQLVTETVNNPKITK